MRDMQYEKMHFQLYEEDIYALLKKDELFQDYTMEQLVLDLDALVNWKNLTPIRDPGRKIVLTKCSEYVTITYIVCL